jgi:hypothetical protein
MTWNRSQPRDAYKFAISVGMTPAQFAIWQGRRLWALYGQWLDLESKPHVLPWIEGVRSVFQVDADNNEGREYDLE